MAVTKAMTDNFRLLKAGKFDPDLLCTVCDGHLGDHENYAFGALNKMNELSGGLRPWLGVETTLLDVDRFLRFCAGIIWKYASTRADLGRIEIGPLYQDVLQRVAFDNAAIPSSIDALLFRLGTQDAGSTFYREPKPDRQLGVNIVRFSLAHFVVFLKLDQRKSDHPPPGSEWIREDGPVKFIIVPFNLFEEGRFSLESRQSNERLRRFLDRRDGVGQGRSGRPIKAN